jgi:hypothetical protein
MAQGPAGVQPQEGEDAMMTKIALLKSSVQIERAITQHPGVKSGL